jgi:hypothetical protein
MTDTARLDSILAKHTAISTFKELLETRASYVPTLDLRQSPDLIEVAQALVSHGRDAYVTGAPMGPYFAKTRFTTPTSELPAPSTEVPAEPPVDEDENEDEGSGEEIVYHLYYEDTCDGDEPPEYASDTDFEDEARAREVAQRIARRERREIRLCEEVMEQGDVASSETLDTIRR